MVKPSTEIGSRQRLISNRAYWGRAWPRLQNVIDVVGVVGILILCETRFVLSGCELPSNKQLQRTVTRRRGDGASAPFHCALAPRFTRQRAAAELQRYTA